MIAKLFELLSGALFPPGEDPLSPSLFFLL